VIFKYIDDLFLILEKDQVKDTLKMFNSIHKNIVFTAEYEKDNKLDFLDITVIRDDSNKFLYKWFKKPIASNRLINFYSNHPHHMKLNTAKNLINRALNLTSLKYHTDTCNQLKTILTDNLFPNYIIQHLLKTYGIASTVKNSNPNFVNPQPNNKQRNETVSIKHNNSKKQTLITTYFLGNNKNDTKEETVAPLTNNTSNNPPKKIIYKPITYIPSLTNKINQTLKTYDCNNIKLAFKPIKKLKEGIYTNTKDKISNNMKKNLVYKINCKDCDKSYIGQTKQFLNKRIQQHIGTTNSNLKSQNDKTMLSKHASTLKHSFDFENTKILHHEHNTFKRGLIESIYIAKDLNNVVNDRKDAGNINSYYSNIISSL